MREQKMPRLTFMTMYNVQVWTAIVQVWTAIVQVWTGLT